MHNIEFVKDQIALKGYFILQAGIYLYEKESLIEDQANWGDEDYMKDFDFTDCNFWVITDSGDTPIGFNSVYDCISIFNSIKGE